MPHVTENLELVLAFAFSFMGALCLSHCDILSLKGREHTRFIDVHGQK